MRDYRLDIIRSIALLLIIMVHTWSLSHIEGTYPVVCYLYHALVANGVPLFVMLSGALVLGSKTTDIRVFYRKRFSRLLIPFIIWSGVVYILSYLIGKYADITDWHSCLRLYVPYLLENRINTAYWYVQMIAVLYLLTPIIQPAIQAMSSRTLGTMLLIGLGIYVLGAYYPDMYWTQFTSKLLYFVWLYIYGYWSYRHLRCTTGNMLILLVGLGIGIVCTLLQIRIIGTSALACSLFALMLYLPNRACTITQKISETSYATYLTHFIVISPLYKIIGWDATTAPVWQSALLPLVTAIVVLVLFTSCYSAIGRLPRIGGWIGIAPSK